jgi:hypothetical protein
MFSCSCRLSPINSPFLAFLLRLSLPPRLLAVRSHTGTPVLTPPQLRNGLVSLWSSSRRDDAFRAECVPRVRLRDFWAERRRYGVATHFVGICRSPRRRRFGHSRAVRMGSLSPASVRTRTQGPPQSSRLDREITRLRDLAPPSPLAVGAPPRRAPHFRPAGLVRPSTVRRGAAPVLRVTDSTGQGRQGGAECCLRCYPCGTLLPELAYSYCSVRKWRGSLHQTHRA